MMTVVITHHIGAVGAEVIKEKRGRGPDDQGRGTRPAGSHGF